GTLMLTMPPQVVVGGGDKLVPALEVDQRGEPQVFIPQGIGPAPYPFRHGTAPGHQLPVKHRGSVGGENPPALCIPLVSCSQQAGHGFTNLMCYPAGEIAVAPYDNLLLFRSEEHTSEL